MINLGTAAVAQPPSPLCFLLIWLLGPCAQGLQHAWQVTVAPQPLLISRPTRTPLSLPPPCPAPGDPPAWGGAGAGGAVDRDCIQDRGQRCGRGGGGRHGGAGLRAGAQSREGSPGGEGSSGATVWQAVAFKKAVAACAQQDGRASSPGESARTWPLPLPAPPLLPLCCLALFLSIPGRPGTGGARFLAPSLDGVALTVILLTVLPVLFSRPRVVWWRWSALCPLRPAWTGWC